MQGVVIKNCYRRSMEANPGSAALTTFLNPYSYLIYRKNKPLFSHFDIFIDGMLLVLLLNLFRKDKYRRTSFDMTSLAPEIFEKAEINHKSFYIVGSEPGVADKAARIFRSRYSDIDIVGVSNGFFSTEKEMHDLVESILIINPDIVIVGMGTPLQEQFLLALSSRGWKGEGYTCGGFLHQTAKRGLVYYPRLMDRFNLRWLFRIYDEPNLLGRYLINYPLFIFYFIYDHLINENGN